MLFCLIFQGSKSKTTNVAGGGGGSGIVNSSTFTVSDLKENANKLINKTNSGGGVNARKIERGAKSQNKPKHNNNAHKSPTAKTDNVVGTLNKKQSQSQINGKSAAKQQETSNSVVQKSTER